MGKKVAVTGGSGQVGLYVCDEFKKAGYDVVVLDVKKPDMKVKYINVDLMDFKETCRVIKGYDQVVHLAAIPNPYIKPMWDKLMPINTGTTFNVMESVFRNGIKRVVLGCSESSTGFGIHLRPIKPLYVPIDEAHPCWPHETYSISKHLSEVIARNYAQVFGIEVLSMRYTWVMLEQFKDEILPLMRCAKAGVFDEKNIWLGAYITARDVARGCVAAANYRFKKGVKVPFDAFFLTAKNTFYPVPTLTVLKKLYGKLPKVKDKTYFRRNPYASVFDIRKAQRMLGWRPRDDWHTYEKWEW